MELRRLIIVALVLLLRLQGLFITAVGVAALSVGGIVQTLGRDSPELWMDAVRTCGLRIATTFLPLGLTIWIVAFSPKARDSPEWQRLELTTGWLALLPVALVGLAAWAIIAAAPLVAVWAEVYAWLDAAGAWVELRQAWSSQTGGIFLALFLSVCLAPFLELAPAASFVAGSAALLILYLLRAPRFPWLFLASILLQGALVAGAYYFLDLSSRLTPPLVRELSEEAEFGGPAVAWIQRHEAVAGPAARHFGWLFLGYLVWVPVVFWSWRPETRRVDHAPGVGSGTERFARLEKVAPKAERVLRGAGSAHEPVASRVHPRLLLGIRLVFLVAGVGVLLLLVADRLGPRARYVSSWPSPGAAVERVPDAVMVSFSHELDRGSTISVQRTVPLSPTGGNSYLSGEKLTTFAGIDPNDLQHRSLRADLLPGLSAGLYRVDWHTVARNGAARSGRFFFGVGMNVPAHLVQNNTLRERDSSDIMVDGSSGSALFAGLFTAALFLGLASFLPQFLRFADWIEGVTD